MFSPCSLLVRFDAQFFGPSRCIVMKENEMGAARGFTQQELPKEDKIAKPLYGAIAWAGISVGTLVMALTLPRHESQNVYRDDNIVQVKSELQILSSERRESLIDEKNDRSLAGIKPEENQKQAEPEVEFKIKNMPLEKSWPEQSEVMKIVENNPQVFSEQDAVDVGMYYPIYKAAGDKFNVDWYLLWIIHQKESTVSRNPNAFNGSNGYVGAVQRNPYFYPEKIVDEASKGLENLADLSQRHPTDWREIAFAAWKISRDRDGYQKRGMSQPLLLALEAYGEDNEANKRWQTYNSLKPIFS